jgi:prevent-host-death family protein
MKKVALAEVKDHFSEYLDEAMKQDIVITRHGQPAGVLVGFGSEDDWFDYRLENDKTFLKRIEQARHSLRAGRGVAWQDVEPKEDRRGLSCEQVSDKPRSRRSRRR